MASTSSQTTLLISSSSSTQNPKKYEVFLSLRGEDTRHGFTSHLYDALKTLGIVVFRDEEKLEKGEEIYPYLKEAIEGSQYAVVIISERFAESKSCLFELSTIMECKRKGRITVFPVFYHVEPSNVRNQRDKFGEYFARLKEDPKVDAAEWEIWKDVLIQVGDCRVDSSKVNKDPLESCGVVLKELGDISGWHVQNRDESNIVKEVSEKIFAGLMNNSVNIDKSLIEIDIPAKEIMELLHLDYGGVRYIGIWGMGGVGKTTLAKVICAIASPKFEARCFIHGIGKKDNLIKLQKQLISAVLSKDVTDSLVTKFDVENVLNSRLINKKVLIVLDDVWRREQLDALANAKWFGEGSRIIITSRSCDWPCLNEDNIYEVKVLNEDAALQLFCSKAFPKCCPEKKPQPLIKKIVNFAKGLPLALEVFGSFLANKKEDYWQSYLAQLKENLHPEVKESLKITFDKLEGRMRNAFLDIVCFFNNKWHRMQKDCLRERLVWLDYYPNIVTDLESKSLIKFAKNEEMFEKEKLCIHDLLLQMGQELADQEGKLWRPDDFISILQGNIGKFEIDKLKIFQTYHSSSGGLELEVFSKMKNLRILEFSGYSLQWCGEYLNLSNELRYMCFPGYPFESFPAGWNPTYLTEIILQNSDYFKRLGNQNFPKLKRISLGCMAAMEETPDLSRAPCLETLRVVCCDNVSSVHPSTGLLEHLKTLSFSHCKNLERFPDRLITTSLETFRLYGCPKLKKIPDEISSKSLKVLTLHYCLELEKTPDLSRAPCLETLDVAFCDNVSSVHPSTGLLQHLKTLSFSHCKNLERFPDRLITTSLETFRLYGCPKLKKIPDEISSKSLKVLTLHECFELESLPGSISTKRLEVVSLYNCRKLKIVSDTISEMPNLRHLEITESSMEKFPFSLRRLPNLEELWLKDIRVGKLVVDIYFSRKIKSVSIRFKEIAPRRLMQQQILYNFISSDEAEFEDFSGYDGKKELLEALFLTLIVSLINCGLESISILKSISHWPISKLDLSRNKFLKLPNNMLILNDCTSLQVLPKLPLSLHSLELGNCLSLKEFNNLMHWVIPSCWFSIKHLNLSNNGFTKLPNNMCELSSLVDLDLSGCTFLWALPKLPLSLRYLSLTNCPLVEMVDSQIITKNSGEMLHVLPCTVAYVGFDCKPHKILYWNPFRDFWDLSAIPLVVCGPMAEARIPEAEVSKWSIHRSTNSNKRIQIPIPVVNEHGERTLAILIFYKVHKCYTRRKRKRNSDELENLIIGANEGNSRILPEFTCKLQYHHIRESLVFYVPKVSQFGPHGVWVFIKFPEHFLLRLGMEEWRCSVSVMANSENVELKACGIQLLNEDDGSKFSQDVELISQPGLDSKSLAASFKNFLRVKGPIKRSS